MSLPLEELKHILRNQLNALWAQRSDTSPAYKADFGISSSRANTLQKEINTNLDDYNLSLNDEKKIDILKNLSKAIEKVEINETPEFLEEDTQFNELSKKIYHFIKNELSKINAQMLYDPEVSKSPLSRVIANMSPEKADALMIILSNFSTNNLPNEFYTQLSNLYQDNPESKEAIDFKEILTTYNISFKGGFNTANFAFTNENLKTEILRVENRLNKSRRLDYSLREKLKDLFINRYSERQTLGKIKNPKTGTDKISTRTLAVTDYYTEGSLLSYAQNRHKEGQESVLNSAAEMGTKMSQFFLALQDFNFFFPDGKLTNFLVETGNNGLVVADTKSFVSSDDKGRYPTNKLTALIKTPGYVLDFVATAKMFLHIENTHAALLGRNLYYYLTLKSPPTRPFNPNEDFKYPIFSNYEEFKDLILDLTRSSPEDRISLFEAQKRLIILGGLSSVKDILQWAFDQSDTKFAIYLAETDSSCLSLKTQDFYTLLDLIDKKNSSECFKTLIKTRYSNDSNKNDFENFPVERFQKKHQSLLLDFAIQYKKIPLINELIKNEALVQNLDNTQFTPLLKFLKASHDKLLSGTIFINNKLIEDLSTLQMQCNKLSQNSAKNINLDLKDKVNTLQSNIGENINIIHRFLKNIEDMSTFIPQLESKIKSKAADSPRAADDDSNFRSFKDVLKEEISIYLEDNQTLLETLSKIDESNKLKLQSLYSVHRNLSIFSADDSPKELSKTPNSLDSMGNSKNK